LQWFCFFQLSEDGCCTDAKGKRDLMRLVEDAGHHAGWTSNDINMLLKDETEMFDMGEGVRFGRSSNIITAGYNKAEAISWYISHIEKQRTLKRTVFVDDNAANVLNVSMMT
jgi:hypothetical protein